MTIDFLYYYDFFYCNSRSPADFEGYFPVADGYLNVAVDYHNYHAFGDYWNDLAEKPQGWGIHLDEACRLRPKTLLLSNVPFSTYTYIQ